MLWLVCRVHQGFSFRLDWEIQRIIRDVRRVVVLDIRLYYSSEYLRNIVFVTETTPMTLVSKVSLTSRMSLSKTVPV